MVSLILSHKIVITLLSPLPPPPKKKMILHTKIGGGKMVLKCLGLSKLRKHRFIIVQNMNYEEKISYLLVNILSTTKIL